MKIFSTFHNFYYYNDTNFVSESHLQHQALKQTITRLSTNLCKLHIQM